MEWVAEACKVQRMHTGKEERLVTEMAIVNTFTKLIFGDEGYSERELMIIQAFRWFDPGARCDSHAGMGEYLRNLGVREMIQLVSQLRQHIAENFETLASLPAATVPSASIGPSRLRRRVR